MPVRKRTVFYFHGFDPATTARYRRIFASASERFDAALEDLPDGGDGWQVTRDGVVTDVRYCRYEDLVRGYRAAPLWRRLWRYCLASYGYVFRSSLAGIGQGGVGPFVLMMAPFVTFLGVYLLTKHLGGYTGFGFVPTMVIGLIFAALVVRWLFLDVVADLFAYMRALALGGTPEWSDYAVRISTLSAQIEPGDADEVLVVGHSLGGIAAILSVAKQLDEWPSEKPIGLLTLGSTHGVVLSQTGTGQAALIAAIRKVTSDPRVFWVDVTSPRDTFCVPLVDPLLMIEKEAHIGMTSPRVISARLRHAPKIPGDRRTVFSAMRRHMGYLLAPEDGSGFDYADTVTGDLTLKERFGPRGNSPKAKMWHG